MANSKTRFNAKLRLTREKKSRKHIIIFSKRWKTSQNDFHRHFEFSTLPRVRHNTYESRRRGIIGGGEQAFESENARAQMDSRNLRKHVTTLCTYIFMINVSVFFPAAALS
jgi:hypothetical protein